MVEFAAAFLIFAGVLLSCVGLGRAGREAGADRPDPGRALGFVRALRIALAGLSLTGLGCGWLFDRDWLVLLSLVFAGEEMWESSVVIAVLKHGAEGRPARPRIPPPPLRMPTPDTLLPSFCAGRSG
jgi:hypothetical protein